MLTRLSISNVVLIDKTEIEFGAGLSVLTGETGAGKSIILDALSLALGGRGDTGLIRHGTDRASVVAEFTNTNYPESIINLLDAVGIEHNDSLLTLRRTLDADGKSRAWINDMPVAIKTLKAVGDELVEIHGQFESHSLLDPATHIASLDEFGCALSNPVCGGDNYQTLLSNVATAYTTLHTAERDLSSLRTTLARAAADREYLSHNVAELTTLNPRVGEEEELSTARAAMMDAEKNAAILSDATDALTAGSGDISEMIFAAAHVLERIKTDPNPYQSQIDKLYDAGAAVADVADAVRPIDTDTMALEQTEERLFALRAAARKHRVTVDELPTKLSEMSAMLSAIDDSDAAVKVAERAVATARKNFDVAAADLHNARTAAAMALRTAIVREFPALKLSGADFDVEITESGPSATGTDTITFMIKTNNGTPFAPLNKIASGGELSRIMLALRVVLMHGNFDRTLIFDEVDTGISGATAAAVGERLARLAAKGQVIVITHSAQVAGAGAHHYLIEKSDDGKTTTTSVREIIGDARLNEIARIISGTKITDDSLRAARELIKVE